MKGSVLFHAHFSHFFPQFAGIHPVVLLFLQRLAPNLANALDTGFFPEYNVVRKREVPRFCGNGALKG